MSSGVVSTSAALGRPFVLDPNADAEVSPPAEPASGRSQSRPPQRADRVDRPGLSGEFASADPRLARVTPASRLGIRPAPEMASCGAPAIDALTGGLPRGCLTELYGPASSGRTTLLLSTLAAATSRGEFCAVVDASDALDPHSALAAGVDLDRFLWVRCGDHPPPKSLSKQKTAQAAFDFNHTSSRQSECRLEQVLRTTDLLLESGGFGLIVLDLSDLPPQAARRIPLTTWFRFRRAVENKPTILLSIEQQPIAGSCSSLLLQLGSANETAAGQSPIDFQIANYIPSSIASSIVSSTHTHLLTGMDISAELIRCRLERKPAHSSAAFESRTAWAG